MRHRLPAWTGFLSALPLCIVTLCLSGITTAAGHGGRLALFLSLLTLAYGFAVLLCRRSAGFPTWFVLAVGLVLRIPLVAAPPVLSDDIYRYVWDGRVSASGVNPFRYAPTDPALEHLRNPDWQKINNPALVTIYPPAAQGLFWLGARLAPGVTGLKGLLVAADFFLAWLLSRRLVRTPGDSWRLVLYWWHPLPVLEFAWSGHVDILGILFLTAALLAVESRRGCAGSVPNGRSRAFLISGALLAAAALVKFIALAAAPFLFGRRWFTAGIAFAAVAIAGYAPFVGSGVNPFGSLAHYAAKWRANDLFFGWLQRSGSLVDQDARLTEAKLYALLIVAALAVLAALLRASRPGAVLAVFGAAIVISPTVHPWYLAWFVPLLSFRFSPAWFFISLAGPLAYHPLPAYMAGHGWHESAGIKIIVMIPFLALLAVEVVRWFSRSGFTPRGRRVSPEPEEYP